jgi:uncharacterized protein (TIGR04255 family)
MGRKYANSPIIDAVAEIRFEATKWDGAIPGIIWQDEQIRLEFGKRQDVHDLGFQLASRPEVVVQTLRPQDRVRYGREDDTAFMEVARDIVAVHHLRPYPTWERFKPLIQKGIDAYVRAAQPGRIQRAGLRYVNRIEFDGDRVELEDYFEFRPYLGSELPHDYGPFMVGAEFPFSDNRDLLRLQLTSTVPEKQGQMPVILDLDYYTARPGALEIGDIPAWLEQAHSHVEEVFEACISERMRAMLQEVKGQC